MNEFSYHTISTTWSLICGVTFYKVIDSINENGILLNIKKAAKEFIKKETKMNIRIDHFELDKIKERAKKEGLKYSSLVRSVLHKYITGQLIEKNK